MKCGENKVSCDSGTDTDIGSLRVTHFSDHYYVRVLTENGTKGSRKGHACLLVNLTLVDSVDSFFDRILNGNYVNVRLCDLTESSVKSCCFT